MKKTLMFCAALSCASLFGLNVESVISKMDAAGRKTAIGKDPSCGSYIVCREEVAVQGDVNVAREQAKLNARQTIAELISVKVSVESTRTTTTKETVKDEDESFEQSEFAKSVTRKDAKQVQRGISVCKESVSGGKIVVYCLLTEQVVDATAALDKAMRKLGPDTVQTTGVGYYNEVVPVSKAHEVAISEAQRNAIAEVLGMSMTSSSAKQSISSESVDKDGNESFACDDSFKAKTFSACAGFVESSRIVNEKTTDSAVFVTIVAKGAKDKVMDDYRAYLESMGNPGFCVRSNDRDLMDACAGFFAGLGLRMVGNLYEAAYVIDAVGRLENGTITVKVTAKDKTSNTVLFPAVVNEGIESPGSSVTASYAKVLNGMKPSLHKNLDQFIGRANADGRRVIVRLCNYDDEYEKVVGIVRRGLEMVPGAKNVKRNRSAKSDSVEFVLNYIGETEDLADFLEKHIKADVKRRLHRPKLGRIENTLVEFDFE